MLKSLLEFFLVFSRPTSNASVGVPGNGTSTFNLASPQADLVAALRGLIANCSWVEAAKLGNVLLDVRPNEAEVLELLAYSQQQQGQYRDAIELCERAYAIAPDRWMTNFVAGVSFKALGMPRMLVYGYRVRLKSLLATRRPCAF
jgi:tetratricopeptide (TPR) repeat protein